MCLVLCSLVKQPDMKLTLMTPIICQLGVTQWVGALRTGHVADGKSLIKSNEHWVALGHACAGLCVTPEISFSALPRLVYWRKAESQTERPTGFGLFHMASSVGAKLVSDPPAGVSTTELLRPVPYTVNTAHRDRLLPMTTPKIELVSACSGFLTLLKFLGLLEACLCAGDLTGAGLDGFTRSVGLSFGEESLVGDRTITTAAATAATAATATTAATAAVGVLLLLLVAVLVLAAH